MKRNVIITIIIALIIVFVVASNRPKSITSEPSVSPTVSSSPNAEEEALIEKQVSSFGTKLKNVSLLAASTTLQTEMEKNYAPYVAPLLLKEWEANPEKALGRNVSSPWPDRIEINSTVRENDSTYKVLGNVIEVTSADTTGRPAGVYPITLTLEKQNDTWLITESEKGAYSELPQETTLSGTWECLPHKDTSGPQTLECAFGIMKDVTNKHYALDMSGLTASKPIDYPTKTHIKVQGVLVPLNQLNTDSWQKYDIAGIIHVTKIEKIK